MLSYRFDMPTKIIAQQVQKADLFDLELKHKHGALVKSEHLEAARYFLDNNLVNINLRSQDEDTQGGTALTAASTSGCTDIVRYLLDNGADIKKINEPYSFHKTFDLQYLKEVNRINDDIINYIKNF